MMSDRESQHKSVSHSVTSLPFPIPVSAKRPWKKDLLLWKREGELGGKTTFAEGGKAAIFSQLPWWLSEYCLAKDCYILCKYNSYGKFRMSPQFVYSLY